MAWKEYLKPDWRKIVLFLIFIGGIFLEKFASPAYTLNSIMNSGSWAATLPNGTVIPLQGKSLIEYLFFDPLLIVWIIVSYLLSCFVVSKYDEMKSKKFKSESIVSRTDKIALVVFTLFLIMLLTILFVFVK
jgi:hypothetical protein